MGKSLPYENRLSLIIGGMIVDGKGALLHKHPIDPDRIEKILKLENLHVLKG
jgi:hypothetical protein